MAGSIPPAGYSVMAWSWAMFVIATTVVALRLTAGRMMLRVVGKEDVAILLALVFSLLQSVFNHLQVTKGGLGQPFSSLTPQQISAFKKYLYFTILTYNASLCLAKVSILYLYLRIFPTTVFRRVLYAVFALLAAYTIWVLLYSTIPCVPPSSFWDGSIPAYCFPDQWMLNAAFNIVTDVLIITIPIPVIMGLHLPRKQKIGVSLIFALGFFICIISILRITTTFSKSGTTDLTRDYIDITIWSIVESNTAIVCASLPTLKPLFARLWPRLLSTMHSTNTHSYLRQNDPSFSGHQLTTRSSKAAGKGDGRMVVVVEQYGEDDSSSRGVLREAEGEEGLVLSSVEGRTGQDARSEESVEGGWSRRQLTR